MSGDSELRRESPKRRAEPSDSDEIINKVVEEWHEGGGFGVKLHEWLGWTWDDYAAWLTRYVARDVVPAKSKSANELAEMVADKIYEKLREAGPDRSGRDALVYAVGCLIASSDIKCGGRS